MPRTLKRSTDKRSLENAIEDLAAQAINRQTRRALAKLRARLDKLRSTEKPAQLMMAR